MPKIRVKSQYLNEILTIKDLTGREHFPTYAVFAEC